MFGPGLPTPLSLALVTEELPFPILRSVDVRLWFCAVRRLLVIFLWVLAVAGLYAALVVLEVYWNLFDWQPRLDAAAFGTIVWMGLMLVALWYLCRASADRLTGGVALVLCAALVALAIYVVAPEPVKPGLLGRDTASPYWYRTGRLVVLALPAAFWLMCRSRRKSVQSAAN